MSLENIKTEQYMCCQNTNLNEYLFCEEFYKYLNYSFGISENQYI